MGVTININGLSLIHQDSNGASTATLPNVCLTPGAGPIPYGSVAFSRELVGGTQSVRVDGGRSAATSRSVFATSTGDEAGTQGGVLSGVRGAESSFLTCSPDVRIEGLPAGRLTDKMLNNRGNTVNAGGATNDAVKRSRRGPRSNEAEKVSVTVLGRGGERVHAPVTVVLQPVTRGKGKVYRKEARSLGGPVVLHNVEKAAYRVLVIHGCYPEGIEELRVNARKEKVTVRLTREKLRTVARFPVGVRFTNLGPTNAREPSHILGARDQFDYIVAGTFWSRYPPPPAPVIPPDWPNLPEWNNYDKGTRDWIAQPAHIMDVEATPLFWTFGFKGDVAPGKPPVPWSPNPDWVKNIGDRAQALEFVKNFITKVIKAFKEPADPPVPHKVVRWIVINEPMNMLTRAVTRMAPFLNAVAPTIEVTDYTSAEKKKLRRDGVMTPPPRPQLAPQAIANFVEILAHTHAELSKFGDTTSGLIVNDYGIEGYSALRGRRFRQMMKGIIVGARSVPGLLPRLRVGLQGHLNSSGDLSPGSDREQETVDTATVRRQMKWFKDRGLKICVTECDVMLPGVKFKVGGKKHTLLGDHLAEGTILAPVVDGEGNPVLKDGVQVKVRQKSDAFMPGQFFKKRRRHYKRGMNAQRLDQRDLLSAIVSEKNVESFTWWDFDDDLEEADGGSNFRYHGYLFHQHLVCQHCKSDPEMKVVDDGGLTFYMKPCYWGTVAAFKHPGMKFRR